MKLIALVLLTGIVAVGCTGETFDRVKLAGNVTIDGQAVPQGTIDFQPQEAGQGPTTTAAIAAGRYDAEVPLGKVKVFFHATRETGKMIDVFDKPQPEIENIIPPAYQSGMEITVAPGETMRDFPLLSK